MVTLSPEILRKIEAIHREQPNPAPWLAYESTISCNCTTHNQRIDFFGSFIAINCFRVGIIFRLVTNPVVPTVGRFSREPHQSKSLPVRQQTNHGRPPPASQSSIFSWRSWFHNFDITVRFLTPDYALEYEWPKKFYSLSDIIDKPYHSKDYWLWRRWRYGGFDKSLDLSLGERSWNPFQMAAQSAPYGWKNRTILVNR